MARINRNKVLEAARKHQSRGQYDKAIAQYRKIVDADPRDVRSLLKIGDLLVRKGDKPNAVETYQRVADHYAQQGFFLKAIAVYKQILKLEPSRLDIQLGLGDMYEQLQLLSDAMSVYEEVAGAYMRAGDLERALSTLGKIVELDPDHIPVRIKYAEALSRAGRADQAASEFAEGARLLKEQGRLDDYVKVAERLLYHRGNDVGVAQDLARTYLEKRDAKRALTKLQVCFKADPKDVNTLGLLADAFLQLNQREKAISVYREISRVHREAGRPQERADALRKILELEPNDADASTSLGNLGLASGRQVMPEPPREEAPVETADKSQASGIIYVDEEIDAEDELVASDVSELEEAAADVSGIEEVAEITEVEELADVTDFEEVQEVVEDVAELPTGFEETEVGDVPNQGIAAIPRNLDPITYAQFQSIPLSGTAALAVPFSPSPMEAALEQADLLLTYGQFDEAKAVIMEIRTYAPDHILVRDKANEIVALAALHASGVASAAPLPITAPPVNGQVTAPPTSMPPHLQAQAIPSVRPFGRPIDSAAPAPKPVSPDEYAPSLTPPGGTSVPPDAEVLEDESFAFAEKLAEELAEVAPAVPAHEGSESIDVENVFEQFKAGVATQIADDDSSTHLDLGIAYKEMGLLPDARREFQVAMADATKRCHCWAMIGLCYLEEGRPHDAVEAFQSGLDTEAKTKFEEIGLYYELANACELAGQPERARTYFEQVCKREEGFRNAEQRLAKLGGPSEDDMDEALLESVDDVNAAFDQLILDDN